VLLDTEEGSGDSNEINGGKEGNMDFSIGNESRSPLIVCKPLKLERARVRVMVMVLAKDVIKTLTIVLVF